MNNKIFIIFLFILAQKIYGANNETTPFFISPKNWEVVNPKHYPPYISISFVKKEISTCRPTLNLAVQKTSLTLDEYVKAAKNIHLKDRNTSYKILQKIRLIQGTGVICKINKTANAIDFEMLQMLFVKDDFAYVITGACKKNEMINYYPTFMKVFSSFQTVDNLFSLICDKKEKADLIQKFNTISISLKGSKETQRKKNLSLFEKYLDKKFTNLGKYFQILLIKQCLQNEGL